MNPERFINCCTCENKKLYLLAIKVAMLQASERRHFYLRSSFDPNDLPWTPMVAHMLENYKLYERNYYFDKPSPEVTELYLFTNDPSYGSMMQISDRGSDQIPWSEYEPTSDQLSGVWMHTYNLWTSRDQQQARDLMTNIETSSFVEAPCLNGEEEDPPHMPRPSDIPLPRTPIPAPQTPFPVPPPAPAVDFGTYWFG